MLQVHIAHAPEPWQHAIGRRCAARLVTPPVCTKHWGQKRKPQPFASLNAFVDRTVEGIDEVDAAAEPEARGEDGP